jgi:predicted GNAT family acetyltransferase
MATFEIEVTDNPQASRYEGRVDGELVGFCDYRMDGRELILPHTETLPAYRGRGVADTIVGFVLKDAEARGLTVVPQCWFVEEFMSREQARPQRPAGLSG